MVVKSEKLDSVMREYLFMNKIEDFINKIRNNLKFDGVQKVLDINFNKNDEMNDIPAIVMFKMLLLVRWFGLSEVKAIQLVRSRPSISNFVCGGDLKYCFDNVMLVNFEILLSQKGIAEQLFKLIDQQMNEKTTEIDFIVGFKDAAANKNIKV